VTNEHSTTIVVQVGLVERERLADPQSGAPKHDDHGPEADSVRVIAGGAHDGDDLLDGRRIGCFVVRRHASMEVGGGRGGPVPSGAIEQLL
jgi:hypothetical protein